MKEFLQKLNSNWLKQECLTHNSVKKDHSTKLHNLSNQKSSNCTIKNIYDLICVDEYFENLGGLETYLCKFLVLRFNCLTVYFGIIKITLVNLKITPSSINNNFE